MNNWRRTKPTIPLESCIILFIAIDVTANDDSDLITMNMATSMAGVDI